MLAAASYVLQNLRNPAQTMLQCVEYQSVLYAGRGSPCKILCTQPRRLSAITVAERVAAERGESCGQNVGYTIRLESKCVL